MKEHLPDENIWGRKNIITLFKILMHRIRECVDNSSMPAWYTYKPPPPESKAAIRNAVSTTWRQLSSWALPGQFITTSTTTAPAIWNAASSGNFVAPPIKTPSVAYKNYRPTALIGPGSNDENSVFDYMEDFVEGCKTDLRDKSYVFVLAFDTAGKVSINNRRWKATALVGVHSNVEIVDSYAESPPGLNGVVRGYKSHFVTYACYARN